jgi:hypothetical protein
LAQFILVQLTSISFILLNLCFISSNEGFPN